MDAKAEIHQLKQELKDYQATLKIVADNLKKFKNLPDQAKELQEVNAKLLACQQKKESIQQELDNKIEELKNSQLSNEEKAGQIIKLLTDNKKELDLITKQLEKSWITYSQQKDKMIEYLTRPCASCECKSQTVKDLSQMRNWLIGVVSFLLLLIFLLLLPKRKTTKNKKIIWNTK